ncbi:hypothetical protein [Streptomyces sp. NPDC058572]|uniref:hypothetical protein n=1 Tax=Streptomyces sp. NPDC058572 TaxID=3346546 RepID=UPI003660A6FB
MPGFCAAWKWLGFGIEPTPLDSRTYVSETPRPWPDDEDNDRPSGHAAVITTFVLGTAGEE